MKRTFIAVKTDPGDRLAEALEKISFRLKNESIKWVDINQLHITLAFLGDTSEDSVKGVSEMLKARCPGTGVIEFAITGIGVFRSITDPRVIWAGVSDATELTRLFENIKQGLEDLDLATEDRQFRPHVTLARVRSVKNQKVLSKIILEYENIVFQKVKISEVIFYESILRQTGPEYIPLKKIRLA